MRAFLVEAPGVAHLAEVADPSPAAGEVLIRVEAVGICGSDLEMVAGMRDRDFCRLPVVLGHEWSGRVVAHGDDVAFPGLGVLVAVEGHNYCGTCAACAEGATQRCARYDEFGFTRNGGYAPLVAARADLCHEMHHASPEVAALTEPTACALHAIERVQPGPSDSVLVVGAGPIGLLATALAATRRPQRLVVCDRRAAVDACATRMGATCVVTGDALEERLRAVLPGGASVVIEAAGAPAAQQLAAAMVARGGRLAVIGIAGEGRTAPMNFDGLVFRDARIEAVFAYPSAVFARAARLLDDRTIDPRPIVSHHMGLSRVDEAFDVLRARHASVSKVLLNPHA